MALRIELGGTEGGGEGMAEGIEGEGEFTGVISPGQKWLTYENERHIMHVCSLIFDRLKSQINLGIRIQEVDKELGRQTASETLVSPPVQNVVVKEIKTHNRENRL